MKQENVEPKWVLTKMKMKMQMKMMMMMKMEVKMKMPPLYCARVHVCLFTNRAAEA